MSSQVEGTAGWDAEWAEDENDQEWTFNAPWHWRLRVWVLNDLNRLRVWK